MSESFSGRMEKAELTENEFVILKSDQSLKKTLLGRVENGRILPLVYKKCRPYGVTPRNVNVPSLPWMLLKDCRIICSLPII